MKRTVLGLVPVLLVLGLILAGCTSPIEPTGGALARAVGGNSTLNAGFNPNDTYMTYGNQGEGYKGDGITTIQVKTSDVTSWAYKTVYNFYLKNGAGDEFLSFCGNYDSAGLGEVGKDATLEFAQKEAIIGALNYINNHYGSIDTWSCTDGSGNLASTLEADNTKLIAQFAIWLILDPGFDIQFDQPGYEDLVAAAKAAVANPETGNISIYFLTGNLWPNDIVGTQPQIVPVIVRPSKPIVFTGDIKIEKTVDGINIAAWAEANKAAYGFSNIADLISFNIYKTTGEGQALGQLVATVSPDSAGNISVSNPGDGWYAVEEVLSPAGAKVFEQPAGVKYILIANGLQYGEVTGFDYDALYTIYNGYNSGDRYVLGWNGTEEDGQHLNNTGDIFQIAVDAPDGTRYWSFCGNAGSVSFAEGGNGYMIAQRMDRDSALYSDFVKAYNYIANKYGDLNAVRPVTQIVTWCLLGAIDPNSDLFAHINWDLVEAGAGAVAGVPDAQAKVLDVIKNYKAYKGLAKIVDVVYMVSASDPTPAGYHDGQPQYVPIYSGESVFTNTSLPVPPPTPPTPPAVLGPAYGSVTATNAGNVPAILAGLNPKNGNPVFETDKKTGAVTTMTPFVVPNSNHFVFAEFSRAELEAGVALDMVVGNKYDIVGHAFVQLVDGNIVITLTGKGSFGATAFNQLPVFNNGNIHSQKVADLAKFGATTGFNHDNKAVLPCPSGDTIYLYIHCDTWQFYL